MGFVGLLGISLLQCFDVLAWPLLALVYPIYCSIKAIETNSISDNQKLNTYWVVFSLILLFQNAFLKLLEWLPLWPYIRIMVVFWLVMPHFDGAFYVYKHLVCPCLTMDSQIVTNWFNERRKEFLFCAEGERYVKENVPEALETIACKVSQAEPNLTGTENSKSGTTVDSHLDCQKHKAAYDALKIKSQAEPMLTQIQNSTIAAMETKVKAVAVATGELERYESSCIRESFLAELERYVQENGPEALERIVACKVIQAKHNLTGTGNSKFAAMEIKEKAIEGVADRNILKTPPLNKVQKGWTFNSDLDSENLMNAIEAPKARNQAEPRLTQIGNGALAAVEASVNPVEIATGRELIECSQNVPKEWIRALEVTIPSETTLNSNLIRIHKASYEALNAKRQAYVPKMALAKSDKYEELGRSIPSIASKSKVPENSIPSSGSKPKWIINRKVQAEEPENSIPNSGVKPKVIINRKVQAGEPEQSVPSSGSKPKIIINRNVQAEEPENSIQSSGLNSKVIIIRKALAEEPENSVPSSGSRPKWIIKRKVHADELESSIPSSGSKPKWIIGQKVHADEPENTVLCSGSKLKVIINRKVQATEEPSEGISSNELKGNL